MFGLYDVIIDGMEECIAICNLYVGRSLAVVTASSEEIALVNNCLLCTTSYTSSHHIGYLCLASDHQMTANMITLRN